MNEITDIYGMLKTNISLKNKCVALGVAISTENDIKEIEKLNTIMHQYLDWYKKIQDAKKARSEMKKFQSTL